MAKIMRKVSAEVQQQFKDRKEYEKCWQSCEVNLVNYIEGAEFE
jgi:hypothetical protein